MWSQKRLSCFSHQAVRGTHTLGCLQLCWLEPFCTQLVCPICTLCPISCGGPLQAPFHKLLGGLPSAWIWLMDGTHGWLEGRRGGSNWASFLFFLSLSALKHFSGNSCFSLSFPAPSSQAFRFSYCYLTLTFAIW